MVLGRLIPSFARSCWLAVVVALFAGSDLSAQKTSEWRPGTLLAIDAHPEGRFFDWGNRTVRLYDGYLYYDLTIELGERDYVVRYEGTGHYFPSAWKIGALIRVRANHGQMELVEYGNSVASARIMDKFKPKRNRTP